MLLAKNTLKIPGIYLSIDDTMPLPTVGPEQISYQSPALNSSDLSQLLLAGRNESQRQDKPTIVKKGSSRPRSAGSIPWTFDFPQASCEPGVLQRAGEPDCPGQSFSTGTEEVTRQGWRDVRAAADSSLAGSSPSVQSMSSPCSLTNPKRHCLEAIRDF